MAAGAMTSRLEDALFYFLGLCGAGFVPAFFLGVFMA
jgi:hypothetical protein